MSDRIVYKGKIYGDVVNADLAVVTVAEANGHIVDPDGTEIYTLEKPGETDVVEIAGGSRIRYGTSDLHTVVCQGLKMTKGDNITQAFNQGFIMPTDLYTSFTLKHGLLQEPAIDGSSEGPWITENYNLIAVSTKENSQQTYAYYCFIPDEGDCKVKERETAYANKNTSTVGRLTISEPGCTIFSGVTDTTNPYTMRFPPTFCLSTKAAAATQSSGSTAKIFNLALGSVDYLGIYFLVEHIVRTEENTLWIYDKENRIYTNNNQIKGYAVIHPFAIGIRQCENNTLPSFRIPINSVLHSRTDSFNLSNGDIVSLKTTNGRDFYVYHSDIDKITPFTISDISGTAFRYYGDVVSIPTNGKNVTPSSYAETDTIELILQQLLGNNIEIYRSDITGTKGVFNVSSNSDGSLFIHTSADSLYIQANDNEYVAYLLINENESTYRVIAPFLNDGELEFAFGTREKLDYITQEQYESMVNMGSNVNEHTP